MRPALSPTASVVGARLAVLFVATVVIMPYVVPQFPPTMDSPSHVYVAKVIHTLGEKGPSEFTEWFTFQWNVPPNLISLGISLGALEMFSVGIAEKMLLSLTGLGLAAAAAFAASVFGLPVLLVTALLAPLALSETAYLGMTNFQISLAFFLVTIGWWELSRRRSRWVRHGVLSLLLVFTYLSHAFGLAAVLLWLGLDLVEPALRRRHSREKKPPHLREVCGGFLLVSLSALPIVALTSLFVFVEANRDAASPMPHLFRDVPVGLRFLGLLLNRSLVLFSEFDLVPGLGWIGLMTMLVFHRVRSSPREEGDGSSTPLLFLLSITAVYTFAPSQVTGSTALLLERLDPIVKLALVLWVAQAALTRRQVILYTAGSIVLISGLGVWRTFQAKSIDPILAEMQAVVEVVEEERTILVLRGGGIHRPSRVFSSRALIRPWAHVGARIAGKHDLVDLTLIQGTGHFSLLRYRSERDPYRYLPREAYRFTLENPTPDVDIAAFNAFTGSPVDYILVLGEPPDPVWLANALPSSYKRVGVSGPRGLASLFAHEGQGTSPQER